MKQICEIATKMHTYFQQAGHVSQVTPSPMEMQQSLLSNEKK